MQPAVHLITQKCDAHPENQTEERAEQDGLDRAAALGFRHEARLNHLRATGSDVGERRQRFSSLAQ